VSTPNASAISSPAAQLRLPPDGISRLSVVSMASAPQIEITETLVAQLNRTGRAPDSGAHVAPRPSTLPNSGQTSAPWSLAADSGPHPRGDEPEEQRQRSGQRVNRKIITATSRIGAEDRGRVRAHPTAGGRRLARDTVNNTSQRHDAVQSDVVASVTQNGGAMIGMPASTMKTDSPTRRTGRAGFHRPPPRCPVHRLFLVLVVVRGGLRPQHRNDQRTRSLP
jgi:hypothetical protein